METTPVIASWLNDANAATYTGKFGTGALLGGLTNPIISASLGANNYVQNYILGTQQMELPQAPILAGMCKQQHSYYWFCWYGIY